MSDARLTHDLVCLILKYLDENYGFCVQKSAAITKPRIENFQKLHLLAHNMLPQKSGV